MVDPVGGPGSTQIDPNQLVEATKSGDFDSIIGPDSALGPDATALLKLQQKFALDQEKMQLLTTLIKDDHETKSQIIQHT